jgi:hypothetical protein
MSGNMTEPPSETEVVRLAKLVKLMRDSQRRYFGGDRSAEAIAHAKDLERRVDKAIAWVLAHRGPNGRQEQLPGMGPRP